MVPSRVYVQYIPVYGSSGGDPIKPFTAIIRTHAYTHPQMYNYTHARLHVHMHTHIYILYTYTTEPDGELGVKSFVTRRTMPTLGSNAPPPPLCSRRRVKPQRIYNIIASRGCAAKRSRRLPPSRPDRETSERERARARTHGRY